MTPGPAGIFSTHPALIFALLPLFPSLGHATEKSLLEKTELASFAGSCLEASSRLAAIANLIGKKGVSMNLLGS